RGHASGATIQHLTLRDLQGLPVPVLDEGTQRRLAAALRPGDEAGRILSLLGEREENPFVVAIATEPLLRDLDGVAEEDGALDRAIALQNRLWVLVTETDAVAPIRTLSGKTTGYGHKNDPFAEWMVGANRAFATVADALDEFGGAERI